MAIIRGMNVEIYTAAKDGDLLRLLRHWQGQLSDIRTRSRENILQVHLRDKGSTVSLQFMRNIIARDPSLLHERDDAEENAFHTAARAGHHEAVKLLLESGGGEYIKVTNKEGDTPLHVACRETNLYVVQELLPGKQGVDRDYIYRANHSGETPIHLAAEIACCDTGETSLVPPANRHCCIILVELITKIPASDYGDSSIGCALHPAVSSKNEGFVRMMMALDNNIIMFQDSNGLTPLHYAALKHWLVGMELLLTSNSGAVYCRDKKGRTVAHIAAECNYVSGLQLLTKLRPDCFGVPDNDGQNAAHRAADRGNGEVLKCFFEDSQSIYLIYQKDKKGDTPLHVFADSIPKLSNDSVISMQQNNVIPLIQKHMKLVFNKERCTPGDIAAKHSHNIFDLKPSNQDLLRQFMAVAPPSSRNKDLREFSSLDKKVAEAERTKEALKVKIRAKTLMHIALTFTAITAACLIQICSSGPERFNQNDTGPSNGSTSILVSLYSSQAFFVFILISLMVSVVASIFNAMVWFKDGRGFWKLVGSWASILTVIIAPVSLLMAIMALLFATKQISGISLSIMVVTSGIFLLVCCVIVAGVFRFKRERSKLENSLV